jgi:hypothetical protein
LLAEHTLLLLLLPRLPFLLLRPLRLLLLPAGRWGRCVGILLSDVWRLSFLLLLLLLLLAPPAAVEVAGSFLFDALLTLPL